MGLLIPILGVLTVVYFAMVRPQLERDKKRGEQLVAKSANEGGFCSLEQVTLLNDTFARFLEKLSRGERPTDAEMIQLRALSPLARKCFPKSVTEEMLRKALGGDLRNAP